jgi:hypothetical protein
VAAVRSDPFYTSLPSFEMGGEEVGGSPLASVAARTPKARPDTGMAEIASPRWEEPADDEGPRRMGMGPGGVEAGPNGAGRHDGSC